jgi:hypothetical protein
MKPSRPFLLTKVQHVKPGPRRTRYSEDQDLSVDVATGKPFVLSDAAPTYSKTHAWPGDDDPDPGQDRCY